MDNEKRAPVDMNQPSVAADGSRLAPGSTDSISEFTYKGKQIPTYITVGDPSTLPDFLKALIRLDTVEEESVDWLMYPYIPKGKISILQGEPGLGKTTIATDLIARLSTGRALPFGPQRISPLNAVIISAEDGVKDTIKPRLRVAGADCSHAFAYDEADSLLPPVSFDDERLEAIIRYTNCALLVFDPLAAFIGPGRSLNNAADVRAALTPLARVAERTHCAILIIAHMNKTVGANALHRLSGAIDIAGAARSVLCLCSDGPNTETCSLVHVKSNLAPRGPAIRLRIAHPIEWIETYEISPEDALYSNSSGLTKQALAERELTSLLSSGPKSATEIYDVLDRKGISKRTVDNAKQELKIGSRRSGKAWEWFFPECDQISLTS